MINSLNSHNSILRDGTSQQDRNIDAIEPDYIAIEDRSIDELISEAQRLAKELQFFDTNNEPAASWESFLIDDPQAFLQGSPEGKRIQQKRWAEELAAYVENPDRFFNDSEKTDKLSKPHVVLFMTFLKLLNHVKSQINGLTQKHLDFYFRDRLGLNPKEAVPDVVNVLIKLTENSEYLEVKKGTIFQAGEDASGNPLEYATEEDTVISKAQITQLNTVFVQKEFLTVKGAHLKGRESADVRFVNMLEMALGEPQPTDALPDFPSDLITDVFELNDQINAGNQAAIDYLNNQLFLSVAQWESLMSKQENERNGLATDWQDAYATLEAAYQQKLKGQRQQALKVIRENEDFETLTKHVYGSPLPLDDLPPYKGESGSFEDVSKDLAKTGTNREKAVEYITEELLLKEEEFVHIFETNKNTNATEEDLDRMYRLLEFADRQIRSFTLPLPSSEKIAEVYATNDARSFTFSQYGEEEESKRFKTLGNRTQSILDQTLKPSELGFAISSPILLLEEGKRTIEILLDLGASEADIDELETIFEDGAPLQTHLSTEENWFTPEEVSFTFGNYVGDALEGDFEISIAGQTITTENTITFDERDIGRYFVDGTQSIYEIIALNSFDEVSVEMVGTLETDHPAVKKYDRNQVYLNSMKVEVTLRQDDPAIVTFGGDAARALFQSEAPSVVFTLNNELQGLTAKQTYRSAYEYFVNAGLHKAHIHVDVQGMKNLVVQNDRNSLDAKKPFEPFGFQPSVGDSFYIANTEVCQKRIMDLRLNIEWSKAPESFKEHYQNYWKIQEDNPSLSENNFTVKSNNDFKADLFFHDKNAEVLLSKVSENAQGQTVSESTQLFENNGKIVVDNIPARMKGTSPDYRYKQALEMTSDDDDVLEWSRYFRLELDPIDFQHSTHNSLFARQALSEKAGIKELLIEQPYEPKIKKFSIGYSACTSVIPTGTNNDTGDQLFHLHPFGFDVLDLSDPQTLIPTYEDEGSLYLGIDELKLPQTLSILFQMAEGSANPDVEKPIIQWMYLRNNEWIDFKALEVLKDTTNGLVNSGIVNLKIPADATTGGTLMPDDLYWIKVSTLRNSTGISDSVDIRTQVLSAKLSSETVDPVHFENPLAAETITEPLDPIVEIDTVEQPFTSSKGKPVEKGSSLYKRISERLRHKNRALTIWDYEHMVLNEFPQVYKAKCLPSKEQIGEVNVVVVPDIIGRLPFNPFAPKVAADTLIQIQKHLNAHTPAFASVFVKNPFYLQVSTECVVRFNTGYDEGFYKAKLIEEIKRFMSPWAYGEDQDIHIGGSLHASVIINFIAERPYIDYVANLKLFQSEDGRTFSDVRGINGGKTIVIPKRSDMIMVAAQIHEVYVVSEAGFDENSFEGINYMEISKDFIVIE